MIVLGTQLKRRVPAWIFWKILASLQKTFSESAQRDRATRHLIPPGNPGAGILYGRQNIAKTLTYRAMRNLDFNSEQRARRLKAKELNDVMG